MKQARSWMQGVKLPELKMLDFILSLYLDFALVYPFVVGSGREYAPASCPVKLSDVVVFVISCRTSSFPSYASSRRRFTFQSEPFLLLNLCIGRLCFCYVYNGNRAHFWVSRVKKLSIRASIWWTGSIESFFLIFLKSTI
jgi:hypothetical protein